MGKTSFSPHFRSNVAGGKIDLIGHANDDSLNAVRVGVEICISTVLLHGVKFQFGPILSGFFSQLVRGSKRDRVFFLRMMGCPKTIKAMTYKTDKINGTCDFWPSEALLRTC